METRTSKAPGAMPPKATEPQEPHVDEKASCVSVASKQQFDKAHRKTSAKHAGLFRRLAK
jgi:hypothetical protein